MFPTICCCWICILLARNVFCTWWQSHLLDHELYLCNSLVLLSSTNLSVGSLALKTETRCQGWLIILVASATVLISELRIHPFYRQQLQQCMALHRCSLSSSFAVRIDNANQLWSKSLLQFSAPWDSKCPLTICCSMMMLLLFGKERLLPLNYSVHISSTTTACRTRFQQQMCREMDKESEEERKVSFLAISCLSTLSSWKELLLMFYLQTKLCCFLHHKQQQQVFHGLFLH